MIRPTRPPAAWLGALLALAASGCDGSLATADVTIPRVCVTEGTLLVPGGASATALGAPFTLDLASVVPLLQTNPSSSLRPDSAVVVVRSGQPDLSGVTGAAVEALPASGAPVTLVSMAGPPAAGATSLVLTGGQVDVVPYLVSGKLRLRFVLQGRAPATSWIADVTTCAHGETHLAY